VAIEMVGVEALFLAALSGLSSIITDVIKEKGTGIIKKIDVNLNDPRKQIIEKYVRRYCEYHGELKVACLGMSDPIELENVYINPKVFERSIKIFESLEDIENHVFNIWNHGSDNSLTIKKKKRN
jgi:hypothetical protein